MRNAEKNPAKVQTVDFSRHGKLKVKTHPGYVHAKTRHLVSLYQLIRQRNRKGVRDQVTSYRIEFASEKQAAANA